MLKFSPRLLCLAASIAITTGCQSAGTGALDLQGYPNINVAPVGEVAAMTPQQEYEMLAELNAALAAQPVMRASDRALYLARQRRLAQIAATHAIDTTRAIEAR